MDYTPEEHCWIDWIYSKIGNRKKSIARTNLGLFPMHLKLIFIFQTAHTHKVHSLKKKNNCSGCRHLLLFTAFFFVEYPINCALPQIEPGKVNWVVLQCNLDSFKFKVVLFFSLVFLPRLKNTVFHKYSCFFQEQ